MKGICPFCEEERILEHITTPEKIKVRGELIDVESQFLKCVSCGNTFDNPQSEFDPLVVAYREYRRRHGITQPEAIKQFRKRYGLTQGELSAILGWGISTLNRYENGSLQDDAHEKILRLAMKPENFLKLIEEAPSALSEDKYRRLIEELQKEEEESLSFERIIELHFGRYEPTESSGYKKLDLPRLFNAILFLCKEPGVMKTKLNKLLFYADFKHFKEYAVSITGARYAHIPFGPAPDNYDYYFAALKGSGELTVEEIPFPEYTGERYVSHRKPDLSIFSESELKILASVKEYFNDFNAGAITKFSHDEDGYKETSDGDIISYKYATKLKI